MFTVLFPILQSLRLPYNEVMDIRSSWALTRTNTFFSTGCIFCCLISSVSGELYLYTLSSTAYFEPSFFCPEKSQPRQCSSPSLLLRTGGPQRPPNVFPDPCCVLFPVPKHMGPAQGRGHSWLLGYLCSVEFQGFSVNSSIQRSSNRGDHGLRKFL